MEDKELQPVVPRSELTKQGVSAASYLAGGVFFMIMAIGAGRGIFGIILTVAALAIGIGALVSKDREDKKPGLIITGAGIMGMISRFGPAFLKPVSGTLLVAGAVGLLAAGIWKGIKFLAGLKSRQ